MTTLLGPVNLEVPGEMDVLASPMGDDEPSGFAVFRVGALETTKAISAASGVSSAPAIGPGTPCQSLKSPATRWVTFATSIEKSAFPSPLTSPKT